MSDSNMRPVDPASAIETQEQKTWRGLSEPDFLIRYLEELSLNALPSLENIFLDGWVVRFANGYTKRANSVNPLYALPTFRSVGSVSDARTAKV